MILLFNATTERFDMQYAGRFVSLDPGEKKEFEDPMAKHLLNSFGPRGLTYLKYGDNEEDIGSKAREVNESFKKRQVEIYNVGNEQRKMMNLGYTPPTKQIKQYALELGIKLLEPYSVRDEERAGISDAKRENETLRKELEEMKAMLRGFILDKKETEQPDSKGEVEENKLSDFDKKWPSVRKGK